MKEDYDPFRPALTKPVDDSVMATDSNPDNFLAGDDRLSNKGSIIDDIKPASQLSKSSFSATHLDQMDNKVDSHLPDGVVPNNPMTLGSPIETPDFGDLSDLVDLSDLTDQDNSLGTESATKTANSNTTELSSSNDQPKKKKGHLLFGKKNKNIDEEKGDHMRNDIIRPETANSETSNEPVQPANISAETSNNLDIPSDFGSLSGLGDLPSEFNLTSDTNTTSNPILDQADQTTQPTNDKKDNKKDKKEKKEKKAKGDQPKQLTISVLTIVFFILFVAAAAGAGYLYTQLNKTNSELGDTKAELQKLKDEGMVVTDSSNKTNTQIGSLQERIKELDQANKDKENVINENKATIDNLNKQVNDLNTRLTETQNKLNADTQVKEQVDELTNTLCTMREFSSSPACQAN